uniref:Uncharacterized protein n=1 Tax=Setaria italica TaxID=4555 RepID=K3YKN5_SETIT
MIAIYSEASMYIILVKFLDHNMRISFFLAFCIVPVTGGCLEKYAFWKPNLLKPQPPNLPQNPTATT